MYNWVKHCLKILYGYEQHGIDNNRHNERKAGSFRYNEDVVKYNQIADSVMKHSKVESIDLYTFTKKLESADIYRDHVHFKDEISEKQAKFIYENLKKLL